MFLPRRRRGRNIPLLQNQLEILQLDTFYNKLIFIERYLWIVSIDRGEAVVYTNK